VRVSDSSGDKKVNDWYTAAEAGCAFGTGTYSVTPAYQVADGDAFWKVKAANATVFAPFSLTMLFTVDVLGGGNASPVANDDTVTVPGDAQTLIDVTGNDTDDGSIDTSTVLIVGNPSNGTIDGANADGTVDYTPTTGYRGPESFTYTVMDDQGIASNVATVNITVDVPAGGGDPGVVTLVSPSGTIAERSPAYTWNADPNATRYRLRVSDSSGDKKVNDWYTAAEAGCASGTGTCSVTPSYELANGDGSWKVRAANDSVTAPFSSPMAFTVDGNAAPVANDDSATVTEGVLSAIDVVGNDTDADGTVDVSTVSVVGNPSNGVINALNADGTVDYTANAGYTGADSFTYTVEDDLGATSNVATVNITVDPASGGGDPGVVTLVSPGGTITERSPTYVWNADPNATENRLRVNDSNGDKKVNDCYTAAEAGCASGAGTCSVTPSNELANGDGSWKVRAANESVTAPFSNQMSFTVSAGNP